MNGSAMHRVRAALGDRVVSDSGAHIDARCPAHKDANRSLSVDARDGAVYVRCHAGCSSDAIAAALNLSMRDLYDGPGETHALSARREVAAYRYTDESGTVLYEKVRYEPKEFRIRYRVGTETVWKAQDVPGGVRWVLYRLPEIRRAIADGAPVIVVEGEKDADALTRLGFAATTNAHGAAKADQRPKWRQKETEQLDGAREVVIIPDNDEPGRAHARAIHASLRALPNPPRVTLLTLPELREHGDVSDWLASGGTADALREMIVNGGGAGTTIAEPHADIPDRAARFSLVRASDVAPERVAWLWPDWLPFGKLVNVDGVAGVGKSTLMTDLIARATRGGPMPNSDDRFPPVSVLIAGVEDGWGDTIRPRLDAAGADVSRVHFVTPSAGESFTVPRDVLDLMRQAGALGATWLHIEAIMGVLDESVSANSDHEVRRAMRTLADAASAAGMLVTFIRHPRKSGGLAVHAGGGSVAFSALARAGLFVGWHPADDTKDADQRRRVVAVSKTNIGRYPESLAFTVVSSSLGNGVGAVSWQGVSTVSADELASPPVPLAERSTTRERPDPRALERAWLRQRLAEGVRVPLDELKASAHADGLAWHRLERAAKDEGVSRERVKAFPSYTVWYLPVLQSMQSTHSMHDSLPVEIGALSALSAATEANEAGPGAEPYPWHVLTDAA